MDGRAGAPSRRDPRRRRIARARRCCGGRPAGDMPSAPPWSSGSARCLTPRARRQVSTPCTATPTFPHATPALRRMSPAWSRLSWNGRPGFRRYGGGSGGSQPQQTEAENPSLVDGDLGGGTYELDQQLIFRPAPELCRHRAPLRGLYVAGASVHPGGSVQGMGGHAAARALLADRRLRPWRA